MISKKETSIYLSLAIFGVLGPILFPSYTLSIAYLWMMVLMASTWDILGGQTGYNSLGNITFFVTGIVAKQNPDLLTLLEPSVFFLPNYDETQKIFKKKTKRIPKELITLHLWESASRKYIKNIHDWGWADKNNKTLYGRMLLSLKDKL